MAEIAAVNAAVKPVETLLVVDAMTGQEAVAVAQAFVAAVPVTGLDPHQDRRRRPRRRRAVDQRGHRRAGQVPGHRREDRRARGLPPRSPRRPDPRHGRRPDPRRAGPGDVRRRPGRARWRRSCARRSFTLEDLLDQLQQIQKMGPIGQIMSMIPGMGGMAKRGPGRRRPRRPQADRGDHPVDDPARAARPDHPQRLTPTPDRGRRRHHLTEVNRLVKQFSEMQKLMKQFSGGGTPCRLGGLIGPALSRGGRHDDDRSDATRPRPTGTGARSPTGPTATRRRAGRAADAGRRAAGAEPRRPPAPDRPAAARRVRPPRSPWSRSSSVVASGASPVARSAGSSPQSTVARATSRPTRSPTASSASTCPATSARTLGEFLRKFPGFADQAALDTEARRGARPAGRRGVRRQADLHRGHQAVVRRRGRASASGRCRSAVRRTPRPARQPRASLAAVGQGRGRSRPAWFDDVADRTRHDRRPRPTRASTLTVVHAPERSRRQCGVRDPRRQVAVLGD